MGIDQRFAFPNLALSNLRRRPSRTSALIFLVTVLSAVLFLGSLISLSLQNGMARFSQLLGADILIVPKGYEQKTERILLHGEPSTFYMNAAWTKKILGIPGVRAASPQLFVASLNTDCCASTVQMIGFDQDTDFTVKPWIKSEICRKLSIDEIVIGANIAGTVGAKLRFFGRDYSIAAKMDNTGTGLDASVFMNIEAAERAADDYVANSGAMGIPEDVVSSVTVLIQDGYSADDVALNISQAFKHENPGISVITAAKIISKVSGSLRATVGLITTLAVLFWILSVLVLGIVFAVILNERKREFGILRSLGATRKNLALLVLLESGLISLTGGVLGIGCCVLLIFSLGVPVLAALNLPYLQPSLMQFVVITMVSLCLSFATGPLASLVSIFKIIRGDTYLVIRDGDV